MGYLETKLYIICKNQFDETTGKHIEENWKRFLDDCFIPLDTNIIQGTELLNILNNLNENIKFTEEHEIHQISFLGIKINQKNSQIWMDIHHKDTDTRRCVPCNSHHPRQTKNNIPFTLARRICTIVEKEDIKKQRLQELVTTLQSQKYPKPVIENAISRASQIPQNELRQSKQQNADNTIAFVSTYNENNPKLFQNIKQTFDFLKANSMKDELKNTKLIHSKKQSPNLKRILTKAEFTEKVEGKVETCGDKRCGCCKRLYKESKYTFKNTGQTFELKSQMSCNSSNLIYVIICDNCGEEYIGETGMGTTKLRDRVRVYHQHIKDQRYTCLDVERHLRECANGEFKIFPFLQLNNKDTEFRRSYERYFQQKFQTKLNKH